MIVGTRPIKDANRSLRKTVRSAEIKISGELVEASTASLKVEEDLVDVSGEDLEGEGRGVLEDAAGLAARKDQGELGVGQILQQALVGGRNVAAGVARAHGAREALGPVLGKDRFMDDLHCGSRRHYSIIGEINSMSMESTKSQHEENTQQCSHSAAKNRNSEDFELGTFLVG